MKKLTLICSTVLLGFGLAGCGNQNHRLDTHSKVKSEKVSSKKSSNSSKSSSSSMSSSSSSAPSIIRVTSATNVNAKQQSQQNIQQNNQSQNNQQSNKNYERQETQWAQQQGYQDPNSTAAKMGYATNCIDNGYYPGGTPVSAEQQEEINKQRGYDTKGNPVMPGQGHAPGCDPFGNDDAWVANQR